MMNELDQEASPLKDLRKLYLWFVIALPALWLVWQITNIITSSANLSNINKNLSKDIAWVIGSNAAMIFAPFLIAYALNVFFYCRKHKAPELAIIQKPFIFTFKFAVFSAVFSLATTIPMTFAQDSYFGTREASYEPHLIFGNIMVVGIYVLISTIVAYIVAIIYATIAKVLDVIIFTPNKKKQI